MSSLVHTDTLYLERNIIILLLIVFLSLCIRPISSLYLLPRCQFLSLRPFTLFQSTLVVLSFPLSTSFSIKADIAAVKADLRESEQRLGAGNAAIWADMKAMEPRLVIKLGGDAMLVTVGSMLGGAIVVVMHLPAPPKAASRKSRYSPVPFISPNSRESAPTRA